MVERERPEQEATGMWADNTMNDLTKIVRRKYGFV